MDVSLQNFHKHVEFVSTFSRFTTFASTFFEIYVFSLPFVCTKLKSNLPKKMFDPHSVFFKMLYDIFFLLERFIRFNETHHSLQQKIRWITDVFGQLILTGVFRENKIINMNCFFLARRLAVDTSDPPKHNPCKSKVNLCVLVRELTSYPRFSYPQKS